MRGPAWFWRSQRHQRTQPIAATVSTLAVANQAVAAHARDGLDDAYLLGRCPRVTARLLETFEVFSGEGLPTFQIGLSARSADQEDMGRIFICEVEEFAMTVSCARVQDNTEPPTFCKLCRAKHGYGDKN